ncbi:hypothetical protein [Bergeyella zoohelcum]|uniref:Uncharacterized protein n=1 Tax=Bergeyella zoohelcum ATCC 43767 TaxID=883096 RepID=K1LIQ4_9FLAO|nr:hypothetical protein [Bergeyella zoohelcum]EKB56600.1 hypothetical protein HMPREF9699_01329 [Bergeyella zoohelcum ATCC 43767]SUV48492.1 Uncharacterised protein [Bergeyella zoohelcum]
MQHSVKNHTQGNNSILSVAATPRHGAISKRRRKLFSLKKSLVSPAQFIKLYGGSFQMKRENGVYFCRFKNKEQNAYACGATFTRAYRRCLQIFHERYSEISNIKLQMSNPKTVA